MLEMNLFGSQTRGPQGQDQKPVQLMNGLHAAGFILILSLLNVCVCCLFYRVQCAVHTE